ncbi:MAG: beta-propeller domain-containing protein [Patescibacteria group bacterium]|nr:beta-propeller domain-containing protein [Patescibacteria group bacterium]
MNKGKQIKTPFLIIILLVLLIGAGFINFLARNIYQLPLFQPPQVSETPQFEEFKKFSSEAEFKDYLQKAELMQGGGLGMGFGLREPMVVVETVGLEETAPLPKGVEIPERVSETTVQVVGIDEPDIVKTNGQEIYFSPSKSYYPRGLIEIIPPPKIKGEVKIIKAFPPADLNLEGKIDEAGDLLLKDNILVVFAGDKISGFDVSSPKNPEKKWKIELEDKSYLVGARLYKDRIYLITKTQIDTYRPCPIEPLKAEGVPLVVKCLDIYHPTINVPIDVTFTASVLNPDSGGIEKTLSFVASSRDSVLYISEKAIYITYSFFEDFIKFYYNFFFEKAKDLVPVPLLEKLKKLIEYDISNQAKFTEFQILLQAHYNSLGDDERLKIQNEFSNRITDYYQEKKRELEKTGIVKIGLERFEVEAVGNIPGTPLNQFSLDEYQEHLRIAATIGERWGWWMFSRMGESANDVYLLDKNLKITGKIQGLGLGERIYSVRFLESRGYLVTFKQIDPFFVLDLSDPENPELKGELKIPGYSSYLHPITEDKILGIGKEASQVKISLFDVENPSQPIELAKYNLDEYWSDILETHHAFLLDKKHRVFFLPGSKGGYIFSYKGNQLKLEKTVSNIRARRAIYINDYLYIIADEKIVVLDEINWERKKELEF